MPTVTSAKISEYYNKYKDQEVYFSKSICEITGLVSEKLKLKVGAYELPCILYASSLEKIIIILNLTENDMQKVKMARGLATIKFCFFHSTAKSPISFFISCHIKKINSFKLTTSSAYMIRLDFNQRPPDDFIEIVGKIIDNSVKFNNRKELRIRLDDKIAASLGMESVKSFVTIDKNIKPCIFADISTSGCCIIMADSPEIEEHKGITVQLSIKGNTVNINAMIIRCEKVNNCPKLTRLGILYDKDEIPYIYKNMINNYLDMLEKIKNNN